MEDPVIIDDSDLIDFFRENINIGDNLETIDIPLTVTTISLRRCKIRKIPRDFFMKFKGLESIDLYANSIESLDFDIPDTVTTLDLSYNKVRSIDTDINNLEYVNFSYNFFDHFPEKLEDIRYDIDHNDIPQKFVHMRDIGVANINDRINDATAHIVNQQFGANGNNFGLRNRPRIPIAQIRNNIGHDFADKVQKQKPRIKDNVHEQNIQEETRKSIKYLIEDSFKKFPREHNYIRDIIKYYHKKRYSSFVLFFVEIIGSRHLKVLNYYDNFPNRIVYDYSNNKSCTMSQILERIWAHAKNDKNKDSIIANLFIQMREGIPVCFVGKYTRLLNTLSSFIDEVKTDIPVNTRITNRIIDLKNKDTSKEEIVADITALMKELNVPEEDQEPWLDAVRES